MNDYSTPIFQPLGLLPFIIKSIAFCSTGFRPRLDNHKAYLSLDKRYVRNAKWWKWMIDELTSLTRILASQHKGAGGHWKHWTAWMILWMSRSLWNREFSSSRTTLVKSVVFASLLECNCDPTRSRRRNISSASRELNRKSWNKMYTGANSNKGSFLELFPRCWLWDVF